MSPELLLSGLDLAGCIFRLYPDVVGETHRATIQSPILKDCYRRTRLTQLLFSYFRITPFLLSNGRAEPSNVATTAGWIESAYSLGLLTGLAPASYLADNIGRKFTVMMGVLLASIGVVSFGFAEKVSTLIIIRFYTGIFAAFIPA